VSNRSRLWIALSCCFGLLASCGGGGNTPPTPPTPTLQSVSVSPSGASVVAGKTQQYSATGGYSDGTTKALSTVNWTTSDSTVATINSTGLLTAVKQGSVTVSAKSGTISGSTSATIGAAQLVSIAVSPQNPSVRINKEQQFVATGTYTDGTMQPLSGVTWSSAPTTFAVIDPTGLAVGVSAGVSTIQATSGNVSGTASLTVFAPPVPPFNYVIGQTLNSGDTDCRGVVLADFNGDGKIDIAVSNQNTKTIAVFLNDGTGNFGSPVTTTVTTPATLGLIAGGDFNEDGKADLVLSTVSGGDQVNRILLGRGDGTFAVQPAILNSGGFLSIVVADVNGDGHQDLVIGQNGSAAISIGKGDGTFVDTVDLQPGSFPGGYFGIAAADFNGDGKLDVMAADDNGQIDFWAGNGDGTFAAPITSGSQGLGLGTLASGDFDGDGKQDILLGSLNAAFIQLGNGDGKFDLNTLEFVYSSTPTNQSQGVVAVAADLTNTGVLDTMATDYGNGILQITLNGSIGLIPPANGIFSFTLAQGISYVAAADLNGDGIKDVVVVNSLTGQVTTINSQK
jgi:hypothetical protein